jgi:hypothetical protein
LLLLGNLFARDLPGTLIKNAEWRPLRTTTTAGAS